MRRIIAVIDKDLKYAEKLAAYFNSHNAGGMKCIAYSDAGRALSEKNYEISVAASDDESATSLNCPVVVLSEDGLCENHKKAVYKYSRADRIMREVLMAYACDSESGIMRVNTGESHLYGIFSPVGRCGKTGFAITLSLALGRSSRTLMLSFDEYPGIFRHIASDACTDMSDVVYSFLKGQYSWSRLAQSVYSFGDMDYVAPVRCPEDLIDIGPDQIYELITKIMRESGYENIVIDIGSLGKNATEIFDLCEKLYMPVVSDAISMLKAGEFLNILNRSGRSDTAMKFEKIELPMDEHQGGLKTLPDDYTSGQIWKYTCDLVEGKIAEEDWAERWM